MSNKHHQVMDVPAATESGTRTKRPKNPGALKVGLLGFGTVGESVARILVDREDLQDRVCLTHVLFRSGTRKQEGRGLGVDPDVVWTTNFNEILESGIDVLVEVTGADCAEEWVKKALDKGIHVVTANKMLMGRKGHELLQLAAKGNAQIRFEAAVGGGVPLIQSVREGLAGDKLDSVSGILNGTSNYVLNRMEVETGVDLTTVLDAARSLGYAEVDPSADIDGHDAAAKLVVLAGIAFRRHLELDAVPRQTIRQLTPIDFKYAHRLGCTIRQVSQVQSGIGGFHAFVGPALVPENSSYGRNFGANNVVNLHGKYGGECSFSGAGAGGNATAVAVISDLLALPSRGTGHQTRPPETWLPGNIIGPPARPYFLRFTVKDEPGILSTISTALARQSINLDAVLQEPGYPKGALPFVITVEECEFASLQAALKEIGDKEFHTAAPLVLPMISGDRRISP